MDFFRFLIWISIKFILYFLCLFVWGLQRLQLILDQINDFSRFLIWIWLCQLWLYLTWQRFLDFIFVFLVCLLIIIQPNIVPKKQFDEYVIQIFATFYSSSFYRTEALVEFKREIKRFWLQPNWLYHWSWILQKQEARFYSFFYPCIKHANGKDGSSYI